MTELREFVHEQLTGRQLVLALADDLLITSWAVSEEKGGLYEVATTFLGQVLKQARGKLNAGTRLSAKLARLSAGDVVQPARRGNSGGEVQGRGEGAMKYLTIQEIQCVGPDSREQRIDPLMEALLDLEAVDDAITDPDLAADLSTGCVDIQMIVDAADPAVAMVKALATLCAASHAIGDATPGARLFKLSDLPAGMPEARRELAVGL
jgi:hypothetical protein